MRSDLLALLAWERPVLLYSRVVGTHDGHSVGAHCGSMALLAEPEAGHGVLGMVMCFTSPPPAVEYASRTICGTCIACTIIYTSLVSKDWLGGSQGSDHTLTPPDVWLPLCRWPQVADRHMDAARDIADRLSQDFGVYADVDDSGRTISKQIREAQVRNSIRAGHMACMSSAW